MEVCLRQPRAPIFAHRDCTDPSAHADLRRSCHYRLGGIVVHAVCSQLLTVTGVWTHCDLYVCISGCCSVLTTSGMPKDIRHKKRLNM